MCIIQVRLCSYHKRKSWPAPGCCVSACSLTGPSPSEPTARTIARRLFLLETGFVHGQDRGCIVSMRRTRSSDASFPPQPVDPWDKNNVPYSPLPPAALSLTLPSDSRRTRRACSRTKEAAESGGPIQWLERRLAHLASRLSHPGTRHSHWFIGLILTGFLHQALASKERGCRGWVSTASAWGADHDEAFLPPVPSPYPALHRSAGWPLASMNSISG